MLCAGSSTDSCGLEYHLKVLQAVDGVTGVSIFGVEGRDKQHGINLYVQRLCVNVNTLSGVQEKCWSQENRC